MKILVLEDEVAKYQSILQVVLEVVPNAKITWVDSYTAYHTSVSTESYDLILLDLIVKRTREERESTDQTDMIIEGTRHFDSKSFATPAVVLTQYLESSDGELYARLNAVNINAIHYDVTSGEWRDSLRTKILTSRPKEKFDCAIICALPSEAAAYESLAADLGGWEAISDLMCRRFSINGKSCVIVTGQRMGLVHAAVIAAYAIERFEPKLVIMSGICGGIAPDATIYDTLVFRNIHQHDAGKWSKDGFKAEHYDIQLLPPVDRALEALIRTPATVSYLKEGIQVAKSEYPDEVENFEVVLDFAVASSGSAVMAENGKTADLSTGQRKLSAFDMEAYSVYEACRLSPMNPKYFAVKTVVDDGGKNKGDKFHRIGCLLSAKFVIHSLTVGHLI